MNGLIESLLAAVRAPSGDNTQPWRFQVDPEAGTVALDVDPTRDPSPMNAGQRMARIALGAALENLLREARGRGLVVEWVTPARHPRPVLRLSGGGTPSATADPAVIARVTNRRLYDGSTLPAPVLADLARQTPERDGVRTHWITGPGRLAALGRVIGKADGLMFGEATMRRAFLDNVRLDAPPGRPVAEGLSPDSLELTAAERWALWGMRRTADGLLRLLGLSRAFATKGRRLVASASGLCLVVAPGDDEATDLDVGRAMQRAWLALTEAGLAAQPMMSLPVLENAIAHGDPALAAALGRDRVRALGEEFRALVPEVDGGRPAFLLRFGVAPPPRGRTGRLPLDAVASYSESRA